MFFEQNENKITRLSISRSLRIAVECVVARSTGKSSLAPFLARYCSIAFKQKKAAEVRGVSPVGGKVEELWRKGFVEKMSFKPEVEERSDGW